jgi:hypothetical protein
MSHAEWFCAVKVTASCVFVAIGDAQRSIEMNVVACGRSLCRGRDLSTQSVVRHSYLNSGRSTNVRGSYNMIGQHQPCNSWTARLIQMSCNISTRLM